MALKVQKRSLWVTGNCLAFRRYNDCMCTFIRFLGLSYILFLCKCIEVQSFPLVETDPKNVQDLREDMELKLECTFGLSLGNNILVTQGSVMEATRVLGSDIPTSVKGLKNARLTHNNTDQGFLQLTVYVNTNRSLNNLTFSCQSDFLNMVKVINSTLPIVVKCKYFCEQLAVLWICVSPSDGPSRNVPSSTRCSNSTSKGSRATVILDASQIVEDPGVPTATVMWKWKDTDELISGQVSGQYENVLNVTVASDDRFREIIALYNNTIGHTMQTFNLQCAKCKLVLSSILQ